MFNKIGAPDLSSGKLGNGFTVVDVSNDGKITNMGLVKHVKQPPWGSVGIRPPCVKGAVSYGGIAAEIGAKNMPPACFLNAPTGGLSVIRQPLRQKSKIFATSPYTGEALKNSPLSRQLVYIVEHLSGALAQAGGGSQVVGGQLRQLFRRGEGPQVGGAAAQHGGVDHTGVKIHR